jgi:hypothetical protein
MVIRGGGCKHAADRYREDFAHGSISMAIGMRYASCMGALLAGKTLSK